jgi:hypothetical protein
MPIGPVRESASAPITDHVRAPSVSTPARPPNEPSPFAKLLHGVGKELQSGESIVKSAIQSTQAGRDLGPTELIALQAGVYRYSEAVDLAAKLVDRATSGVKTVLQGGGQ